jgi:hypothetical protein
MLRKSIPALVGLPLVGMILTATASAQGSNTCSSAQAIAGEGTFPFNNQGATTDGNSSGCPNSIQNDVWFLWTAPSTDLFEIKTCGLTGIDSMLAAYDSLTCPPSNPLACNDDSCGLQSSIQFNANSGSQYLVRVGNFPGANTGSGNINIATGVACSGLTTGPDVIVGDLYDIEKYGAVNGVTGYALGTISCNVGDTPLQWQGGSSNHPVIGQNVYRLEDGRFEQIGMSWLKHGFTALTGSLCCSCQNPGTGSLLGVGCSDPYSAGLNGSQSGLGPRSEVNAWTGNFPYPFGTQGQTGNATYKRIQIANADLDTATHPSAMIFGEGQYVAKDDSTSGNQLNNVSWRPLSVGSFSGGGWNLFLAGQTVREEPAIQAWQNVHPDVRLSEIQATGDGLMIVGSKATDNGNGTWHYEYAIYNMNSHRNTGHFIVPLTAGANPFNIEFHAPESHSGEPYSNAPWTTQVFADRIEWFTDTFDDDKDANAVRWGTLYNFRFDSGQAPVDALADVKFFVPGSPSDATASVYAPGGGASCFMANYCTTSPNSAGPGATILGSGSTSVAANDFAVSTFTNPVGQSGIFFMGDAQSALPFGNGIRCAGGSITRYSVQQTDGLGEASLAIDNTTAPALGKIVPGSTWNWQWWYRDPMGGGAAFNTSDGLTVSYCP